MSNRIGFYVEIHCHLDEEQKIIDYVLHELSKELSEKFKNTSDEDNHEVCITPHHCDYGYQYYMKMMTYKKLIEYHQQEISDLKDVIGEVEEAMFERDSMPEIALSWEEGNR